MREAGASEFPAFRVATDLHAGYNPPRHRGAFGVKGASIVSPSTVTYERFMLR